MRFAGAAEAVSAGVVPAASSGPSVSSGRRVVALASAVAKLNTIGAAAAALSVTVNDAFSEPLAGSLTDALDTDAVGGGGSATELVLPDAIALGPDVPTALAALTRYS